MVHVCCQILRMLHSIPGSQMICPLPMLLPLLSLSLCKHADRSALPSHGLSYSYTVWCLPSLDLLGSQRNHWIHCGLT